MNNPVHLPFKDGKGGVDIGLRPIEDSSWLEIDHLFSEEIALKEKLYSEKKDEVLVTSQNSQDTQKEALDLVLEHLKNHHNDSYELKTDSIESKRNNRLYYYDDFQDPLELASLLIQEDLIIMKPKENIFYLDSASLCAPTRWSLREKFQQSLSELHQSVPGYKDKIDSRVNTIFTNLPDQKIFERYNWSIFDSPELFQPVGNKSLVEIKNTQPDKLFIRVERQTIRRLDYSRAVLFAVRVHVNPITDIINNKKAISDLIQAIQNLEQDMKTYKVIEPFEENLINWLKSKNE